MLIGQQKTRVGIGETGFAAASQHGGNRVRPDHEMRQPADRSPGGEDEIERAGRQKRRPIDRAQDEARLEPGLFRECAHKRECHRGKIETGGDGAAAGQAKRVASDMTWQIKDTLSRNIAELRCFDRVESILAGTKALEQTGAGCVARLDDGALVLEHVQVD